MLQELKTAEKVNLAHIWIIDYINNQLTKKSSSTV